MRRFLSNYFDLLLFLLECLFHACFPSFDGFDGDNIVFVTVTVPASAEVRCPRNASNVFADEWASERCGQHEQHLSAGDFYELFLQHPTTDRFDMLCR